MFVGWRYALEDIFITYSIKYNYFLMYRVGQWVLTNFNRSLLFKYYKQSNETYCILFNIKIISNCCQQKSLLLKITLLEWPFCKSRLSVFSKVLSITLCRICRSMAVISRLMFSFNSNNVCGLLVNTLDFKI